MPNRLTRWFFSGLWWKIPLLLFLFVLVSIVSLPFAVHAFRLAGLPDAPEPFDVGAARHVEVAPGDNTFEVYSAAVEKLTPASAVARGQLDALEGTWADVPAELREWLNQNRAALDLFLAGTARPDFLYHQPGDIQIDTPLAVLQELRSLARLALLEAMRLAGAGDVAPAWRWNLAVFRSSRHAGMHGCLIEHLVGNALHSQATRSIARWAADPRVGAELLRTALQDVQNTYRLTAPVSTPLKVEYLVLVRTISDSEGRAKLAASIDSPEASRLGILLYPLGEPEMSLRVARLAWTNVLSQCDRPRYMRRATLPGKSALYDEDANAVAPAAGLPPKKLAEWIDRAILFRLVSVATEQAILASDREQTREAQLELLLAAQLYYREHGEFPDSADRLVGAYIEALPVDPFGTGGPLHYRRESDRAGATIWSVGPDGRDDDARIDVLQPPRQAGDMILRASSPVAAETQ